jgi:hypothetical protein
MKSGGDPWKNQPAACGTHRRDGRRKRKALPWLRFQDCGGSAALKKVQAVNNVWIQHFGGEGPL